MVFLTLENFIYRVLPILSITLTWGEKLETEIMKSLLCAKLFSDFFAIESDKVLTLVAFCNKKKNTSEFKHPIFSLQKCGALKSAEYGIII